MYFDQMDQKNLFELYDFELRGFYCYSLHTVGASLVKGIAFDPYDPEIAGPDIFGKLVPMEAHEASSMYRCVLLAELFKKN